MLTTSRALLLAASALALITLATPAAHAEETVAVAAETAAADAADQPAAVSELLVTGARTRTSAVTGLDMSLRETPQSVSIVGQERIVDFGLIDANQLLAQINGINVEKVETDRIYYNSRGFDITNFQVDGIGLPLIWGIQFGDLDTVLFERVEAVRGANSMMTGTGNPSATINYVRKRPTAERQGSLAVGYGSWNDFRLEADISGPLNASGTLSGRLIYANTDKETHLDFNAVNRNVYAGLLAWDVTPGLTATVGHSRQDNLSSGVLWGALPLNYALPDGGRIDHPVSASTSADWTFWDVHDETSFGELAWRLGNGWQVKTVATYKRFNELAKLLYAFGNPDRATGLGVEGMSGIYPSRYQSYILDAYAAGPFTAFGREHQLVVGGQASHSKGTEYEDFFLGQLLYPPLGEWGRTQVAEPTYPGAYLAAFGSDRLYRFYAATHLSLADNLKMVAGFNALKLSSDGESYGSDQSREAKKASPYLGAVWDVSERFSLYANYTDIFNPQSETDADNNKLPPAHGSSYEAGFKGELLDKRLYVTGAVFRSEQQDLAEFVDTDPTTGRSIYDAIGVTATGWELEATGRLSDRWQVGGGYTQLKIEGDDGAAIRTYTPRRTLKANATWTAQELRGLALGAQLRWQSAVTVEDIVTIRQDAYAVLDLFAGMDLSQRVRATLNVKNATDETYLSSLQWNQSFYAAPRSVAVRLDYRF